MIHAIGIQRFILIVALVGFAAVLGAFQYMVAVPKKVKTKQELNSVNGEISTLQTELQNMQSNMHIFEARKVVFQEMQDKGFFDEQDRADARDRINTIQKLSKVITAKYEINPASVEEQDTAEAFEYTVIKSDVKVTLEAVDDTDIYRFIYYLNYGFPGQITIKSLRMERGMKLDENVIKEIGRGKPPVLATAVMEVEWRTMARKDAVAMPTSAEGRGGGE